MLPLHDMPYRANLTHINFFTAGPDGRSGEHKNFRDQFLTVEGVFGVFAASVFSRF